MYVPEGWYLKLIGLEILDEESGRVWSVETIGPCNAEDDGFAVIDPGLRYWPVFFHRAAPAASDCWCEPVKIAITQLLRHTCGEISVEQVRVSHGPSLKVVNRRFAKLLKKLGEPGYSPLYWDGSVCTTAPPPEFEDEE